MAEEQQVDRRALRAGRGRGGMRVRNRVMQHGDVIGRQIQQPCQRGPVALAENQNQFGAPGTSA